MPINLEVDGVEYSNFTDATVNIALDTLANDFNFEAVSSEDSFLPFKGGEACVVVIDGERVLTGFIESIDGRHSAIEHRISISGRDKTGDLIDSSIGALNDIRAPITLKQLIERVIKHIGADITVIDTVSPEPFNKAEDIMSPSPGDNAFEFIEGYAQKRQVLLTSNADGNVVITNSNAVKGTGKIQHAIATQGNNVIDATWSYRTTDLYNKYIQLGQQDPVALDFGEATTDDGIIAQDSSSIDSSIREGRQLVSVADKGFSKDQLQKSAEWSKKVRRARSTVYSSQVQGFRGIGGDVWAVNEIVPVVDDFADINRELLVNTVSFAYSTRGSLTTLGFVEKNAYILLAQEPVPVGTDQDTFKLT